MLTVDPSFEFEKRRNEPVKYNRELWQKTIESMKKITTIRERRETHFVMQRLRKATELELHQDIRDVQKNLTLIRSPAAGLRERRAKEEAQEAAMMEDDEENITYVDAKQLEKKLEESGGVESDTEMLVEV
jgi:large subunit ribosomal protein L24e